MTKTFGKGCLLDAEQQVRGFLAKIAGRAGEASLPRSERDSFGKHISFVDRHPEDDALFTQIGYPWHGTNEVACFLSFTGRSQHDQLQILERLLLESKIKPAFYKATSDLLDRLVESGQLNQTAFAQIYSRFRRLPDPPKKTGPNNSERNTLIITLMNILRAEYGLPAVRNSASDQDGDACGIIVRVLNDEFPAIICGEKNEGRPALNLSRDAVRIVWERHRKRLKDLSQSQGN